MYENLSKRQKQILVAFGGWKPVTTRMIANKLNLNVNGVAQTLGTLLVKRLVVCLDGKGGERQWRLARIHTIQTDTPHFE